MTDTTDLDLAPRTTRPLAEWAVAPRRHRLGARALITNAIIRARPVALFNLALVMCAFSGAAMVLLVARVFGAAA